MTKKYETIDLDLSMEDLESVVKNITRSYTKESKSYLKFGTEETSTLMESLGNATFNEYVIKALQYLLENDFDKDVDNSV